MRLFGSLVSAAVVTGAGLAYYVYRQKTRTGASYLDVIKQLPGEVQRASVDARQRAAEAVEKGFAAARRRDAELAVRIEAAAGPSAPAPSSSFAAPDASAPETGSTEAGPAATGPAAV